EKGGVAHRFGTARDHHVGAASRDLHDRVDHSLQARAAAPIDLQSWRRDWQTGVECDHSTDRWRFHRRVALREDHILDRVTGNAGARQKAGDRRGAEFSCAHVAKYSAKATYRRTHRLT